MNNLYLRQLLEAMKSLLGIYKNMSLSELARQDLGKDFTEDKICPDDVSCSFAVTTILKNYFKMRGKDFPIIMGTDSLNRYLLKSKYFKELTLLEIGFSIPPNTIVVSPKTPYVHGHTGIVDNDGKIMNNNSATGLWVKSYDLESWTKTFVEDRRLKTYFYKVLI